MQAIDILKNYKLKCKEKFNSTYRHQLARLIKILFTSTLKCITHGILKGMINLTYNCQCNCDYCWCGSYEKQLNKELSFPELKIIIDQIALYPSFFTLVSFIGGEPLLRKDIYQLIEYAHRKGLFTEMETNGILLSETSALKIKKAGLSHIFIRIEGSGKKEHDLISKADGCFDRAVEGIKNCLREKISCSIFMNATKEKIYNGEIEKIIKLAKKLKVASVRMIFPTLSGRWLNEENQILTHKEEFEVTKFCEPNFVYLESSYSCTRKSRRICPSLSKKFFHISCYGEVQPCPFVPISFGDLREKALSEVLNKMWNHPIFNVNYTGCLMNDIDFRKQYILSANLNSSYSNIVL
jgi:MoaA/NifB/PqqE/SkfB family radical SAM enzyme